MRGIIGRKLGMTQVYDDQGTAITVTVVEAGPCTVLAKRTPEKHGYSALQLGFGRRSLRKTNKSILGHVAGLEKTPPAQIREVHWDDVEGFEVGQTLGPDCFEKGQFVDVTGRTKGRGFQGVVKRWNFGGGRASHGGGWTRKPGSIGMCVNPGKVYKGRKMPGQMGSVRRTVENLQVVDVRADDNVLLVKGAIPGPNGGSVIVRSARKK
jgi:large subunit ribosomal protein L3